MPTSGDIVRFYLGGKPALAAVARVTSTRVRSQGDGVTGPLLIGVSTSEVRRPEDHRLVPQCEPPRSELALGERYLEAVRVAGALPEPRAPDAAGAA
jgi:hypothetical protein